jgi:hypothetical protein
VQNIDDKVWNLLDARPWMWWGPEWKWWNWDDCGWLIVTVEAIHAKHQ